MSLSETKPFKIVSLECSRCQDAISCQRYTIVLNLYLSLPSCPRKMCCFFLIVCLVTVVCVKIEDCALLVLRLSDTALSGAN